MYPTVPPTGSRNSVTPDTELGLALESPRGGRVVSPFKSWCASDLGEPTLTFVQNKVRDLPVDPLNGTNTISQPHGRGN